MAYDNTAPVTVNETKSLLLLILLLVLVAAGISLAVYLNRPAKALPPIAAAPAAIPDAAPAPPPRRQPSQRFQRRRPFPNRAPMDNPPEGISHPRDNLTIVRAGSTYATFTINPENKNIYISRSHPRDDKNTLWVMANAVQRIVNDPKTAEHYETTPDQVAVLKALHVTYPQFTDAQRKTLHDLFTTLQSAKPEDRPATEKTLIQALADTPIPAAEQKSFEESIARARAILRADQLDLIDNNL